MAAAAGIDLSSVEALAPAINSWAASVEERLKVIVETIPKIPDATIERIQALAAESRARVAAPQVADPRGGEAPRANYADLIAGILPLVGNALKSNTDDTMTSLAKEALLNNINMAKAITNAVVSQITAKATKQVADSVLPE